MGREPGGYQQRLCIMEATADGVGLVPLQYFMSCTRWARLQKRFTKVVLRRLFINGEHPRGDVPKKPKSVLLRAPESRGAMP